MNNQTDNKTDSKKVNKTENKADNLTLFITLCEILEDISKTKKRLEIQEILSNYFKKINNDSSLLITILYLCTGRIAPDHYNKEMGIGETTIIKVVSEVTGLKVQKIKQEMSVTGDLGLIGMKKRVSQLFVSKQPKLTVFQVFHTLQSLSEEQGFKSINSKINKMISLISKSNPLETKYLIRLFEGKLKIGLALKTVLISLSQAFSYKTYDSDSVSSITSSSIINPVLPITNSHIPHSTPHTYSLNSDCSEEVKFAYNKCPVFEELIPLLIKHGPYQLNNYCKIKCGIPLKPMLAQPHNNINNVYKKLQNTHFTCEYKYDGERAQIHKFDNTFMVFSRNSENLTEKYPDLEVNISKFPYKNFILDTEIVAFDFCNQKILPFQLLSTRKRKEVRVEDIQIEIHVFIFDILFFEDTELLHYPLQHRRNILIKYFSNPNTKFKIVTFKDISDVDVDSKVDVDLDSKLDNDSKLNSDKVNKDKNIINSKTKDNNITEGNNINNDNKINNITEGNQIQAENNSQDIIEDNIQEDIIQSIDNFLTQSILDGCEGIMIKTLTTHSTYTPSKRSSNWIKIKKDYLQNISDTLDLVVIGAYYGKGKRTGNFGGFLLASYNDETDCYESVCKIGTGFDEQILSSISYKIRHGLTISSDIGGESDGGGEDDGKDIEIEEKEGKKIKEIEDKEIIINNNTNKEINNYTNTNTNKTNNITNTKDTNNSINNNITNNITLCISKPPPNYIYTHNTQPDIWITPTLVWEVKAAGFTLSPIYKSGHHSNKKGISLRFPRFIRERTDKKPEDSTTSSQIVSMYNLCNNTEENEDTDY